MTKSIAHNIDGNVRIAASSERIGTYIHFEDMLREESRLSGSPITTPTTVPIKAICSVSSIAQNAVSSKLESTFAISSATISRFGTPLIKSSGFAPMFADITTTTTAIVMPNPRFFVGFNCYTSLVSVFQSNRRFENQQCFHHQHQFLILCDPR